MTYENTGGEEGAGEYVPRRHRILHYHGEAVRALFVAGAVILIVAKSTGGDIPLSTFSTVVAAVVLVVVAGITNPTQFWIHWLNAFLAAYGTILFGITAVEHYRTGTNIFDLSFIYIETLALLSLIALYFTTRTVRGLHMKHRL